MPTKTFAKQWRILWAWCDGHERYEIRAVERHIGSEMFERHCLESWGATQPYRITHEKPPLHTYDQPWTHPPEEQCGCAACRYRARHPQ